MQVSIIIINYNTYTLTCQCIESILSYTSAIDYEIVVVDNASTKENPEDFLIRFPDIKLIKSNENGGFAKGNNLGIKHASGEILLLLNSDTYLTENSIFKASDFLNKNPCMLTVKLVYEDGTYQHNARKFRSIKNEILDLIRPLLWLLPYRKRAQLMLNQYFHGDFNTACDWVSGAFMMFPKTILELLPDKKLDERFFMYGEDQLWCYQLLEKGISSYFLSETSVVHIANASTEPVKQLKLLKTIFNREMEIIKYIYGKSLYYVLFYIIFGIKENARYYVKFLVHKFFKFRIR